MQKGSAKLLGKIMVGLKPDELKAFYTITMAKRLSPNGRILDLSDTIL